MAIKSKKNVSRDVLVKALDRILNAANIPDDSANGLQVEGAARVHRVGLAVDACMAASNLAVKKGCDFLVAHHGLIWRKPIRLVNAFGRHVRFLHAHDINLYAAHLPLDLHPGLGNNAELSRIVGLRDIKPFGWYRDRCIGFQGMLAKSRTIRNLADDLDNALGGRSVLLPFGRSVIRTVGIVSGGAAEELGEAIEKGLDCYVTGEPGHICHHLALEAGINVIFAGHYHTEKPGVQAIGKWLSKRFGLETVFLDLPTLV